MSSSFFTDQSPAADFETLTVSSTALGITSSRITVNRGNGFFSHAGKVFITTEVASVRARWDGGTPTAGVGHLIVPGSSLTLEGEANIQNLRLIRVTVDATASVTIYF